MPTAHINGIDLNYRARGQGDALVLIMGLGGPERAWFFQARAFSHHYRVVTFDNRGVGKTQDRGRPFTMKDMAGDVVALLDHLGIERAHLLGYSMGGMVAQVVAIDHPHRVQKLVLAATAAAGPGAGPTSPEMARALGIEGEPAALDPSSHGPALDRLDPGRLVVTLVDLAFGSRLLRALGRCLGRAAGVLARLRGRRPRLAGMERQLCAIAGANTVDRLHEIQAPTLVMTGTADRLILPSCSELLVSRIPNATLVTVEGGSHSFGFEMSRRFNQEVLAFLSKDLDLLRSAPK